MIRWLPVRDAGICFTPSVQPPLNEPNLRSPSSRAMVAGLPAGSEIASD